MSIQGPHQNCDNSPNFSSDGLDDESFRAGQLVGYCEGCKDLWKKITGDVSSRMANSIMPIFTYVHVLDYSVLFVVKGINL
jgi:hypothetical protein